MSGFQARGGLDVRPGRAFDAKSRIANVVVPFIFLDASLLAFPPVLVIQNFRKINGQFLRMALSAINARPSLFALPLRFPAGAPLSSGVSTATGYTAEGDPEMGHPALAVTRE
jgi:hypothetical protein